MLVQTLSFEADPVGRRAAGVLRRCRAPDRRVVVDAFTKWVQSDRFLGTPRNLLDRGLRVERRATLEMLRSLQGDGVGVRFVNPWGLLWRRAAARNHKKLVAIDDRIVYLGGFNLTEHNFAWHDMMLRIEDAGVGAFCREDFEHTWAGRNVSSAAAFPGLELLMLDGWGNRRLFGRVLGLIAGARDEIVLETPYLSFPFTEALAEACRRGVRVRLVTPVDNNYRLLKRYICREGPGCGMEVRFLPGMTHLKAMLVDGETLVAGSSNFHYLSYRIHQEVVALVRDPAVVADFRARVLEPDLAGSTPLEQADPAPARLGRLGLLRMRAGGWALAELARQRGFPRSPGGPTGPTWPRSDVPVNDPPTTFRTSSSRASP